MRDRIPQLVIPNAGQKFNCNHFNQLLGPGVYVFLQNERPMYVGVGKTVLRRLSGIHHKRDILSKCDTLLIYPCNNINDANELEGILLHGLKPRCNDRRKTAVAQRLLGLKYADSLRHLV